MYDECSQGVFDPFFCNPVLMDYSWSQILGGLFSVGFSCLLLRCIVYFSSSLSCFKELAFVIFVLLPSGGTGAGMENIKIVLNYSYADSYLYPPIGK